MASVRPESVALIGESPAFLAALEHISRAAALVKPVLVLGERGTGKELLAARLHYLSPRWDQPLVKVNCAALTESLLESELFGHEAGAFTGATRRHIGCFEQADGGTLILDELGAIPMRMQEQILRATEYGEFRRVGGNETLTTHARIVGVTNEDLKALAARGRFRRDLLDRLAFDVIHVPPLRARSEDIMQLAFHFAVNITSELKREVFPGFTAHAEDALLEYEWPGNVRELKNAVERSVYRADGTTALDSIEFDPLVSPYATNDEAAETSATSSTQDEAGMAAPELPAIGDFHAAIASFEIDLLNRALARTHYRQKQAAELLGLSYHQLRGLLRKHGLVGQRADAS